MAVSGTSPVRRAMKLEKKTVEGYSIIGAKTYDDDAPARVKEAGQFGISADGSVNWVYDNFVARKITP